MTIVSRMLYPLLFLLSVAFFFLAADVVLAAEVPIVLGPGDAVPQPDGPVAIGLNLYLTALGAVVPLVGYVLNHYAPWASEPVKGIVQGALAAGVAVLFQAATPGDLGLNDATLVAVLTAIAGSLAGHFAWTRARINVALGGGTNKDGTVSDPKIVPVDPPGVID